MTRNNGDFDRGRFSEPEEGNESLKFNGEKIYHGSPIEITNGAVNPGKDGSAWAADHPKEAHRYGKQRNKNSQIHVYEVQPFDPEEVEVMHGPKIYNGNLVKHYSSDLGFNIIRKLDPGEYE